MPDSYLWRTWASTDPTPSFTATQYLDDGVPFDFTTNSNFGTANIDFQMVAGPSFTQYWEAIDTLGVPSKGSSVIFRAIVAKDVVPFGIYGWTWEIYGTPNGATAETLLSAGPGVNSGADMSQTVTLSAGVYYDGFRFFATTTKTGAFVNGRFSDFRLLSPTGATVLSLGATGTLLFGGAASLTATAAPTAAPTACVCCHYDYGHAIDCPNYTIPGPVVNPFTVAGPCANTFAVAAACASSVFAVAPAAYCPPYTINAGRQEGCACPTPASVTALMQATGSLTFGGIASPIYSETLFITAALEAWTNAGIVLSGTERVGICVTGPVIFANEPGTGGLWFSYPEGAYASPSGSTAIFPTGGFPVHAGPMDTAGVYPTQVVNLVAAGVKPFAVVLAAKAEGSGPPTTTAYTGGFLPNRQTTYTAGTFAASSRLWLILNDQNTRFGIDNTGFFTATITVYP